MPTLHQTFTPVTIHTAKCDICNQHNRSVLFRCADCGWHVCTPCWTEKGGDGTHVMNEGADRGWRGVDVGVGRGRGRGAGDGREGVGAGESGVRRRRTTDVGGEEEGGRARIQNPRTRRDGGDAVRDPAPTPISVAAAADLLIQAASRATPSPSPSPSLSPRPSVSLQRPSPTASSRPSGRAGTRLSATTRPSTSVMPTTITTTNAPATRPSPSTSTSVLASASRRENANINRLLWAAETIDRSSTPPLAPVPLPVRGSAGWSGRGSERERRAASPLFVEYGLVEVEEEVLVESDDDDYDGGNGDDAMMGMGMGLEMTPEPRSADEDMCDEMRNDSPGRVLEMSDDGREVVGGSSRVPEPVAGEREVGMSMGGRDEGVVRRRKGKGKGKDDAGDKVPVARRLRELYRSAVMVKDRKGRMRRVGGGLVERREGA